MIIKFGFCTAAMMVLVLTAACSTTKNVSLPKLKTVPATLNQQITVSDERTGAKNDQNESRISAAEPETTHFLPLDLPLENYIVRAISLRCATVNCAVPKDQNFKIVVKDLDLRFKKANVLHKDYTISIQTQVESSGAGTGSPTAKPAAVAVNATKTASVNANAEGRSGTQTVPGLMAESLDVLLAAYAERFVQTFLN